MNEQNSGSSLSNNLYKNRNVCQNVENDVDINR